MQNLLVANNHGSFFSFIISYFCRISVSGGVLQGFLSSWTKLFSCIDPVVKIEILSAHVHDRCTFFWRYREGVEISSSSTPEDDNFSFFFSQLEKLSKLSLKG